MPAATLFRVSIVMSVVLAIVGAFVDAIPGLIPEELWQAHESVVPQGLRTKDFILIAVGLPLVIGGLVSTVGLYLFRPWAPRVALYITIGSLFIYPFVDVQIVSPWSQLLTEASLLLWGGVLAMALLPPLAERFKGLRANNSMQPTGQERPAAD